MAKDEAAGYENKVVSPGSESDPDGKRSEPKRDNPPAREAWPGGVGNSSKSKPKA